MEKELKYKQLNLWINEETGNDIETTVHTENSSNKVPILFRNTIPEIPSTTYATFAIYKYPAKFIPQVNCIYVKCSTPQQPILQFFIEVCGFSRLLDFANEKIPYNDELFKNYLGEIRKRIKAYKCGEIQTCLKGFICGYFKTSEYSPVKEGETLPFMGSVREERYLVPINKLKYAKEDWIKFLQDIKLI
ncbi:MAG: hypothetical protein ACUVXI_16355 [bacterium]